jgi:hypothetical protein
VEETPLAYLVSSCSGGGHGPSGSCWNPLDAGGAIDNLTMDATTAPYEVLSVTLVVGLDGGLGSNCEVLKFVGHFGLFAFWFVLVCW